jgi:hypothetical protein
LFGASDNGSFQDVLYGFALVADDAPSGVVVRVMGDQNADHEASARQIYATSRPRGWGYGRLAPELAFGDMRQNLGLQA